jgi:hypothetical protein
MKADTWKSTTAEVAAWNADGDWHNFGHDQVDGWKSTDEVLEFVSFVASNELNTESPFSDDWDDDEDDEGEDDTLVDDVSAAVAALGHEK